MGKVLASGGGGGSTGSDDCTAGKAQVLAGYTAVTSDSEDEAVTGTMPNNGEQFATLKCGQSKQIPAGYTTGGTVTAADLASQTVGDATAAYIYKGKTAWVNGSKLTGNMTCQSVLSFSVAAYSTFQVLATWKNPAKGPFTGVIICAKTGGYPTNKDDSRVYTGGGSNSAANGTSSAVIGNLQAGQTYYFRIWGYVTCSAGNFYSANKDATCKITAHGRKAFTSSGTFTVPAGVRSINIHCTGGGQGGGRGGYHSSSDVYGGDGGNGGGTSYKNNISVSPNNVISIIVGAGGNAGTSSSIGGNGSDSYATFNKATLVMATGGKSNYGSGGGGGGEAASRYNGGNRNSTAGASNGGNSYHKGQGSSTKEFGTGTLYSGGGGGGASSRYDSGSESNTICAGNFGGSGGGGNGGNIMNRAGQIWSNSNGILAESGGSGSSGTGGGGGGGSYGNNASNGGAGGSGNVIITW